MEKIVIVKRSCH